MTLSGWRPSRMGRRVCDAGIGRGSVRGSGKTLREAVREAVRALSEAGVHSAEYDAVALAALALRTTPGEVHKLMIVGAPVPAGFADLVAERARRVPLQHLTGRAGFRRLELSVGPGVFIPRFETELTAGLAIEFLRTATGAGLRTVAVDLCGGSGAIALAIKDEIPAAEVHGVELSELAHAWAIRNRDDLGLDVDLRLGDATLAFPDLQAEVDVVVSNPPYIPVGSIPNDPEVRDHDPEVALYGGSHDGLRIPLEIAARAAVLLRPGGLFVMEHADVQGDSLQTALGATGLWLDIRDHQDLNGRPRAVTAVRAQDVRAPRPAN
jgi:release factor glutamine methyltransferase